MTKTITNKQVVLEVARIMNLFEGDISKKNLLEKLDERYNPKPCEECHSKPGYHTINCSVNGGFHPLE